MAAPTGTPDQPWDLVVVGAGPAGATAAIAARHARPEARVLLLDRSDFPRDKACGDGIAPHVLDVLDRFGLGDVVDDWAPVPDLELARGDLLTRGTMRRPARVVPRAVFDARLVDAACDAGAQLRRHRVRHVEPHQDGVVLDDTIHAKVVIGADGASSVVRRQLGRPPARRRALAIRGYAPTRRDHDGLQVIRFGQRRQPSYAWAFDRGDGLSNIGYGELVQPGADLTRAVMLDRLDELLPGVAQDAADWRGHHLPLSEARWHQPDGPVLLVGDAAGLINPMTGEGIYYAVATGALAGAVAAVSAPGAAGERHRILVRRLLARHLLSTTIGSRLAERPGVLDGGLRAATADQRVFDDLVEMGLGRGVLTPRVLAGLARSVRPFARRGPTLHVPAG
ncbi:NAD(P)/FAD-dependent oxidoreductase [Luteipulveratus flavus]|uniref:Geranylgeranyl reductase family protein n=1 Tax=Luteipulveratus flavus TaxID=3031728 RepID=A0ABT6CD52_9MICO|nr:geranylgeranyl reductase family protein [Luteipulveratus sp. YIM 133296]MDF8266327.1 geranylgeranyl reductase family protein [Luteipulveratus sp. YIM 133296]